VKRLLGIALAFAFAAVAIGETLPAAERVRIESLIAAVEKLPDATFVRNGKAYKPATAAKFLRGKWDDRAREVRTADDFIVKVASKSGTTGRPYLVRFADGREITTAEFFRAELAKMR
jgi:membrane-bound lytic murein transglycosylase